LSAYSIPRSCLLLNEKAFYFLDIDYYGLSVSTGEGQTLYELKESLLVAQGTLDAAHQIHLAYITDSGDFCYSVILPTGHHQTMSLGKLDTQNQRYERLFVYPVGKVIHIFYASSHFGLPDVWRITHLFWNGETWKSAMLGEVVHPRYPMYQVLLDSRSNLHVLMMTFLGSRSVVMSSMFNGTFYLWSKRQEVLSISREVVDMTAILTSKDEGHLFWAAKQPASERFELGHGVKSKMNDFRTNWRIDSAPAANLEGPWRGIGAIQSQGVLSLLVHCKQAAAFQIQDGGWRPVQALTGDFSPLYLIHKSHTTTYTFWLRHQTKKLPLFGQELSIGSNLESISSLSVPSASAPSASAPSVSTSSVPTPPISPPPVPAPSTDTLSFADSIPKSFMPDHLAFIPQEAAPESNTSLQSSSGPDSPSGRDSTLNQGNTSSQDRALDQDSASSQDSPTGSESVTDSSPVASSDSLLQLTSIFSELKDHTLNVTNNLKSIGDNMTDLAKGLGPLNENLNLLQELIEQNTQTLDALQKLDLLSQLVVQNTQTLAALEKLESTVNLLQGAVYDLQNIFSDLQISQAVTAKKGFWQKWLT